MPTPSGTAIPSTYMFDNSTEDAERQVELLGQILDGHTETVLAGLDIQIDWQCLDLGSGGGTVAGLLTDQFGADRVVAIDQDPRHIHPRDGLEIRTSDVMDADLGDGVYDLIHARLLFMHLPQREQLLHRAITALKPGGLLVISDWDCTHLDEMLLTGRDELRDAFRAFQQALISLGARRGMDAGWARGIPAVFAAAGLTDISGLVHNQLWRGGQPGMQLHACNSRQKQKSLLGAGVTMRQLDVLRDGMDDPEVLGYTYPMYTAAGRRPL
ncbi:class I SAM-dependent methyltransferase [Actinoplanes sp. NPDC026619]|uniref:class I SAM-dependent methyltransferase n=1 Tax=Actinoplanes sp. NPDC026619 TaxID=3155798 RepID=UPI0033FF2D70